MILYKKGIIRDTRKSGISYVQARRIKSALITIQNTPIDELKRLEKVKKINVDGRDDIYVYRVDLRNRIVLSIDQKQKKAIVQSIVDSGKIHSL